MTLHNETRSPAANEPHSGDDQQDTEDRVDAGEQGGTTTKGQRRR